MGEVSIQRIAARFKKLKREELERLFFILREVLYPSGQDYKQFIQDLRESEFSTGRTCPHCFSTHVIMYGTFKGRQRYRCEDPNCRKTFSDFTRSPLARTRYPEKWILFAECMLKNKTLRKTAKEIHIALSTAFYWRHKLLKALQNLDAARFEGITEADETFFLFSEKGQRNIKDITGRDPRRRGGVASKRGLSHEQVCVMVAFDRDKNRTSSKVACTGMISKESIDRVMGPFMTKDTVLCTDANRAYRPYCKDKNIQLVQLKKDQKKHGIYHVQHVNSYHSGLKKWMRVFNGVASKYLNGYLAWFEFKVKKAETAMNAKTKEMIIEVCLKGLETATTCRSIRLSRFAV